MTGASSGIGAATCRKLREQGWHVAGVARRPSDEASMSLQLDVTSFEQLEEALRAFRGCGCSCTAPGRFSLSGRC